MLAKRFLPATALSLLLLALVVAPTAEAHKTTYTPDGKVRIVWGFLSEPAITMTKTGLDLHLYHNATGAPIEGAEKTLNASLVYGDQVHRFEKLAAQHGQKGRYTEVVTLTRPGIYSLRLEGAINGTAVQMDVQAAHEIAGIEDTYFPALGAAAGDADISAKVAQLEAKIAALEAKAQTQSGTPATLTPQAPASNAVPGPGLAATLALVAVAALLLIRRKA